MITHRQNSRQHRLGLRARALATAAAAATAAIGGLVAAPPAAHATIKINEAMLNAPGTNSTQDFIELKGTPGESFSLHMIMLEGDAGAAGGVGALDHINALSGTIGSNGLFLRDTFGAAVTINPAIDPATTRVNGAPTIGHENAAVTWLLVSGFDPAATPVGTDLDPNDDGILDLTPWTAVLDAVGSGDNDSNGDRTYAAQFGGGDFNINSSAIPTPADGKPELIAFRDPDGAMHTASIMATTGQTQPIGGPYTVTNGGFTVQSGYIATPGSANNPVTTGARAWIGTAGGSFNTGANWTGGAAPSAPGHVAIFDGGGANTLTLDADATAGVLTFNGGNHTIAAGGGTLTLDTTSGNANVLGQWGNATVNAPTKLLKATNMRIGRTASVTFGNLNANGQNITKNGIGDLTIGAGTSIGTLNISSGGMKLTSDNSHNKVLVINSLVMSGTTSRLDITDNKIITNTTPGTPTNGTYSGVQGMVQKAYDFSAWDGRGVALLTSMPDAIAGLTTIGVATGEQMRGLGPTDTDTFAGQTITGASTIAMYTYAGDANLDGVIDGGDYGIIDNNIQAQGAPFPTGAPAGLGSVTAVPEPTAACGVALLTTALVARRRRRA